MRGILIGFAVGVACLQQQAALPGVAVICALVLMFGFACAIAFCLPRFRAPSLMRPHWSLALVTPPGVPTHDCNVYCPLRSRTATSS